eukprot:CAMPEP_0170829354 /NCGR_PEP_ID=MMETSP0733-20121128/48558_1 /TAXON_ID=186038 /ORGANISM="Fragilariopsis kerguelensis, Strain L26-C5" /LENGTH=68 /DNA_ID=CAMNT_0011194195 /DNA_START=466 /DNA_END=673 /DNA_ORIENTATION=-
MEVYDIRGKGVFATVRAVKPLSNDEGDNDDDSDGDSDSDCDDDDKNNNTNEDGQQPPYVLALSCPESK